MPPSLPPSIGDQFRAYVKAFNSHSFDNFSKYWADDIFVHLPACPPLQGKDAIRQLLEQGLSFFRETIHPTFVVEGQKSLAMEAKVDTEMLQDMPLPFPFTGKTYVKGDKFVYSTIVHYEFDDDHLIKTFRAFSTILSPDPGAGISQRVLDGFDPISSEASE